MCADKRSYNVLFLCQHNSARSILGEALVNSMPASGLCAYSAGSDPADAVHPQTLALLESLSIPTDKLYPKHWDTFAAPDAPPMDFVFTVCDKTASQTCPAWPNKPVTGHWGIADPSRVVDGPEQERQAFRDALHHISRRVHLFMSLPIASRDRLTLQRDVEIIGRDTPDASSEPEV